MHDLADAGTPRSGALGSAERRHSRRISGASESPGWRRPRPARRISRQPRGGSGCRQAALGRSNGRKRFARGIDYHLLYKRFLIERGATHFLAPQIEGAEGKIAVATARQLGLSVMVPIDCRSLTGTYFAADAYAGLPAHAAPREDLLPKSAEFIRSYRKSATPAQSAPNDFVPIEGDDELICDEPLPCLRGSLDCSARRPSDLIYSYPIKFGRQC